MKLTFLGANHEVTGSNYLLELSDGYKIMVDCGMFQGYKFAEDKNYENFRFNPSEIDAVLVTHAHLDHTGRLPKLVAGGYHKDIYSTEATRDLTRIVLEDTANLMAEEAQRFDDFKLLYSLDDVNQTFVNWKTIDYHQKFELKPGVSVYYRDAGHILGSASIQIIAEGKTITFSGDIGNPPVPFLNKTETVDSTDILIIESTYGGRLHEPANHRKGILAAIINEVAHQGGVLMIPAFAIERSQELLYDINDLINNRLIPSLPTYLDSPMAIKVTETFERYKKLYNAADQKKSLSDNLLDFPKLHLTESATLSKEINNVSGSKIIIAGAGMMHGGRILHHAIRYLPDERSHLLIVGYQVDGSLGRRLLDGDKMVKIFKEMVHVKAKVSKIESYSGHADQNGLLGFVRAIHEHLPNHIFITHGEFEQSQTLAAKIKQEFSIDSTIPEFGKTIEI
jgi:metallo-beta-lactamase family protein